MVSPTPSSLDSSSTTSSRSSPTELVPSKEGAFVSVQVDAEANPPVIAPPDYPEGGLRGWLTVVGGTIITFCTFGVVQSFGVYQDYYSQHTLSEHTPSQISLIGSLQVFFVFFLGLPAGWLFDAGYFHHTQLSGAAIYMFSIFMLSLAKPHQYYQHILSQGVGMGLGMGLMFLPALTVSSHYFRVKRSQAMGIIIAGSSLGGVVYPVLLNNIFQKTSGFQWGVRSVAFMDLGLLIIANSIMRTRLPPKKKKADNSEPTASMRTVLKDIPFLVYTLGSFFIFWGVFVPFFYLQLYSSLHGVNAKFTKYSITVMNAASIFGRTIPNFVADHYGPLNVLIPSGIISAALIFAMFGATSVAGVATFGVFYGFFSGGMVSLVAPAVGSFVTHRDLSDLGIRIGIVSSMLSFALLTGNPIAGALLTTHHIWNRPIIFGALSVFVGALCYMLTWKSVSKRRNSTKI